MDSFIAHDFKLKTTSCNSQAEKFCDFKVRKNKIARLHNEVKLANKYKLNFITTPKILLIEDTPMIQYIHTEFLKRLGCAVELAKNGYEAIAMAICNNSYDLILLDIGLPDMEGTNVASIIRSLENHNKKIPIIAITGYGDYFSENYLAAGINEVFVKPVMLEGLADILKRWLTHYLEPTKL